MQGAMLGSSVLHSTSAFSWPALSRNRQRVAIHRHHSGRRRLRTLGVPRWAPKGSRCLFGASTRLIPP